MTEDMSARQPSGSPPNGNGDEWEDAGTAPVEPGRAWWLKGLIFVVLVALAATYIAKMGGGQKGGISTTQPHTGTRHVFRIEGMHCDGCAGLIQSKVQHLPGVISAKVSFEESKAWVTAGPNGPTVADMVAAIAKAGYRAEALAQSQP